MKGEDIVCAYRNIRRVALGSKSPLAYQNFFEIITRHDGVKYHYAMSNESTEPKADKIVEEPTDEPNGTTIRINIKDEDVYQVSRDCVKQLAYFKTVYVKNELEYYDNNFTIYEKGLWKLRNCDRPFATMHICLGQVAYPINWEVLEIEPVRVPVALSFNVGELDVTVSREEINYTDRVRKLVTERINAVVDELSDLYNEQLLLDDIFDYFKVVSNREKPDLIIEDVSFKMTGFKSKLKFKSFPTLKIKKEDAHSIFAGYSITKVWNGNVDKNFSRVNIRFSDIVDAYLIKDKMNFHDTRYVNSGILLKKRKHTKKTFHLFAEALGLVKCSNEKVVSNYIYEEGSAKTIIEFIKFIDENIESKLRQYDGICPEYVKEDYREEQRIAKEHKKDSVTFYTANNERRSTNVQVLLDKKYVFYVKRDKSFKHKNTVLAMYNTLNGSFKNSTLLVYLAQTSIDKLKKHETIIPFEEVFSLSETSNHFYSYNIANLIETNLKPLKKVFNYSSYYMSLYNKLYLKFGIDLVLNVNTEKNTGYYGNTEEVNLFDYFNEYITKSTTTKNYSEYKTIYRTLVDVTNKLKVLQYLCDDTPNNIVAELIRGKGITKMNEEFYKTNINEDEETH